MTLIQKYMETSTIYLLHGEKERKRGEGEKERGGRKREGRGRK